MAKNGWIDVHERMPEPKYEGGYSDEVVVRIDAGKGPFRRLGRWDSEDQSWIGFNQSLLNLYVTHWQPAPKLEIE